MEVTSPSDRIRNFVRVQLPAAMSSGLRKVLVQEVVIGEIGEQHGQAILGVLEETTDYAGISHLKSIRKADGGRLQVLPALANQSQHCEGGVHVA